MCCDPVRSVVSYGCEPLSLRAKGLRIAARIGCSDRVNKVQIRNPVLGKRSEEAVK